MSVCPGKKGKGASCYSPLFKCKKCSNVGCEKTFGNNINDPNPANASNACTNAGFSLGKCLKCGSFGSKVQM
jgi:hypothetical protein